MLAATGSTMTQATSSVSVGHDVVGDDERVGDLRLGDAGRAGEAEGGDAAAGLGEEGVGVAVVAAGELHDLPAAGEPAGDADGGHRRLGAARHEADELDDGTRSTDRLGEEHLALGRRAVARAVLGGGLDGLDDGGVGVAEDDGAVALDEVDVAAALDVPHVGALGAVDEVRRAADAAEGAHRRVHPAGDDALGPGEQRLVRRRLRSPVARLGDAHAHGRSASASSRAA